MPSSLVRPRRPRVFFGWWVVLTAFLSDVVVGIVGPVILGFFLIPMTQALHIGRGAFSLAFALKTMAEGVSGPVVGALVDRYGPRMLMVLGGLFSGLGLMALGGTRTLWQLLLVMLLMGFVTEGAGRLVSTVTIARWFVRRRGRAMALAIMGFSAGVTLFSPISQGLIAVIGWRYSWVILGSTIWVLVIPAALAFMRKSPEGMGLRPDGDPPESASGLPPRHPPKEEAQWSLRMATRTRSLWLLTVALFLGMGVTSAVALHQVSMVVDLGFGPAVAATVVLLFGITSMISKLGTGFLAERIPVQYLLVACLVGSGSSLFLLLVAHSKAMVFLYGVTYGLLRGALPFLNSLVWADYFGRTFLGSIRGVVQPVDVAARAGGPLLAGLLFDLTESYTIALVVFVAAYLVAAAVMVFASPPRQQTVAGQPPAQGSPAP